MASQVLSTPQEPWFTSIRGPVRRNTKRIAMGHRHPDCIAYQMQSAWVSSPKRCNISFGYQKLLDGQRNSNKYQDSIHLNRCWSATIHRYPQVIQSWPRGTLGLLPHGFRKLFLDRWAGHIKPWPVQSRTRSHIPERHPSSLGNRRKWGSWRHGIKWHQVFFTLTYIKS
jgi:hypothetical protein